MQKTAFKVFLCSFSVSMLAISMANRAFLHAKNYDYAPPDISGKNISLFIKDTAPSSYPVKKIDLSVLDDANITPPDEELIDFNDSIVVADDLNFQDAPPDEKSTEAFQADDDEDQKIFLADVVYSQDKPLEQLATDEDVIDRRTNVVAEEKQVPEVVNKPVVYADNAIGDSLIPADNKGINDKPIDNRPADGLIPIMYDGNTQTLADIKIDSPDNLNNVAMKIGNVPIESMNIETSDKTESSPDKEKWEQMEDNPWLIARSNGSKKNKFSDGNLGTATNKDFEEVLDIQKPKKGVEVATETVKNLVIPLPEKLADDENLMPRLAYPESSSDARKEKAMNAMSLRKEKEKEEKKLLTEIEDEEDISMIPPEEETSSTEKKGLWSSIVSKFSNKTEDLKTKLEEAASKAKLKLQARKNIKLAADANRRISIVPKEIRMSFQPNRAEISGQTLRWVQAFATKAAQEEGIYLEVRVDATRPSVLQKRRLNLLYNILTNKGVEYSKINIVYTSREPNSFILRMVDLGENERKTKKKIKKTSTAHLQW